MALTAPAGGPAADMIRGVQSYLNKILKPKDPSRAIDGMKALLLDRETKTIVSMVYSMHEILSKEGACVRVGWACARPAPRPGPGAAPRRRVRRGGGGGQPHSARRRALRAAASATR